MITVKFIKPRLGFLAGAVWRTDKIGVANTLISMRVCTEIKDDDKLDAKKNVKRKRNAGNARRNKGSSKA